METYKFDVIIIGAGIVGLAIAHKLSRKCDNILLVEKESSFGRHVSSRNSEVIHSGIYYDPNSLKAKLCIEGNRIMYDFAQEHQIDHKKCGKFIVIPSEQDIDRLEILMQNGIDNGLEGLQMFTAAEVSKREPQIKSAGALYVPSSGIIDSHAVMQKLEHLIDSKESTIVYNTKVVDINAEIDNYRVLFKDIDYQAESKILINSAGLWCEKVSAMVGISDYELHFCKGEYYKTSKYRNKVNTLIYPLPNDISLGIHIVVHLDGTIGFGPNAYYVDKIDYNMDSSHKDDFLTEINTYLNLDGKDLSEDFTGIRPKIQQHGEPPQDFVIVNESERGYKNFINLIGIESPGLTASMAIAEYVDNIIC